MCDVDVSQMESAILNLAINARDAMPEGGALTIETANLPESDARAAVPSEMTPREYVTLAVSDTGTGMPSDVLVHAFEPFFSTKKSDENGQGGTGLGLAFCREVIESHKGGLRVESTLGEGTSFTLRLPLTVAASGRKSA